jgi:HSP20 family protein
MYQEKDDLVIKAELPGVQKEGLEVSLEGDTLHIKAEKKEEREEADEETKYYACERVYGSYHRTVSLPFPIEAVKISATFEGGVLEVRLPKAEEAKPKQIKIETKAE